MKTFSRAQLRKYLPAKLFLSILFVAIAAFDTFWQSLSPIAATALALSVAPWIYGLIEKIVMPDGTEVFLKEAEQRLEELPEQPNQKDIEAFKYFESNDPNLALAMLRVQIERRMREMAEEVMLRPSSNGKPYSFQSLASALAKEDQITPATLRMIRDLTPLMNDAVHGVDIPETAIELTRKLGPRLLANLRATA